MEVWRVWSEVQLHFAIPFPEWPEPMPLVILAFRDPLLMQEIWFLWFPVCFREETSQQEDTETGALGQLRQDVASSTNDLLFKISAEWWNANEMKRMNENGRLRSWITMSVTTGAALFGYNTVNFSIVQPCQLPDRHLFVKPKSPTRSPTRSRPASATTQLWQRDTVNAYLIECFERERSCFHHFPPLKLLSSSDSFRFGLKWVEVGWRVF